MTGQRTTTEKHFLVILVMAFVGALLMTAFWVYDRTLYRVLEYTS